MSELQVQLRSVDALIPYGKNARTHSAEQIGKVAASIQEFGWTNPILIGPDHVVIAGHARLAAAKKLRMTEVPVIVLDHLNQAQRCALVIADNQLALEAGWDEELLRAELRALDSTDVALDVMGFDDAELAALLASEDDSVGHADEDAVPELSDEPTITMPGDLWILGSHRVLCGDATQREAIEKVMGAGLADMVFPDPPYNVDCRGGPQRHSWQRRAIANDDLGAAFAAFLGPACANLLAVTKGAIYICMSSSQLDCLQRRLRPQAGTGRPS